MCVKYEPPEPEGNYDCHHCQDTGEVEFYYEAEETGEWTLRTVVVNMSSSLPVVWRDGKGGRAMKCTWCRREYKEKMIEDLDKSPLFGVPVCDRCWEAEEEAYIEVIGDLERNIDKTHRWPMYWRVLEKVAENPWEHIPLIKLAKKTREEKANDNRLEARMVAPNEVYSGKVWRSDQKGCKNQNQYSRG